MKDKDKEEFDKWMKWMMCKDRNDGIFGYYNNFTRDEWVAYKAWQAALEYKQKDIDELKDKIDHQDSLIFELDENVQVFMEKSKALQAENERLKEAISYLPKVPTQPYDKELAQIIQKLQAENAKLREAMEFVLGYDGDFLSTSAEIRLNAAKCVVEQVLKELDEKL